MNKEWMSEVTDCCLCDKKLEGVMYDTNIHGQGWGLTCHECFSRYKLETGQGKGQKYIYQEETGKWLLSESSR